MEKYLYDLTGEILPEHDVVEHPFSADEEFWRQAAEYDPMPLSETYHASDHYHADTKNDHDSYTMEQGFEHGVLPESVRAHRVNNQQ